MRFAARSLYGEGGIENLGAVNLNGLKFTNGVVAVVASDLLPTVTLLDPGATEANVTVTAYNPGGTILTAGSLTVAAGDTITEPLYTVVGITLTPENHIELTSDADLKGLQTIYENGRMVMLTVLTLPR
ncbi:MAG: hypothetical protein JXD19_10870 [Deltaproteobacteria bacterium]|nr:hypothetical protein [Deltaproteobacteria bacterium]